MNDFRRMLARLGTLFRIGRLERELDDELLFHIEMQIEANIRRGMSPAEARTTALRSLGGMEVTKEQVREESRARFIETLFQDLRYGIRMMLKRPGFTLVAVLTLAIGIGSSTSIFSVVNGIVLQPLSYRDPEQLVRLWTSGQSDDRDNWDGARFLDVEAQIESLEIAGYVGAALNLTGDDLPRLVEGISVTSNWFDLLGVGAYQGRVFSPDIEVPGEGRSAVLSYGFWQSEFGGRDGILGEDIELSNESYAVVGVLPPGIGYPEGAEVWVSSRYRVPDPPFDFGGDPGEIRGAEYFHVIGRLKGGVTIEQAGEELDAIAAGLREEYPSFYYEERFNPVPMRDAIVGDVRPALLILFGAVGFVLLIACANVANLLLVRASGREKEIAVRMAIGANRSRIIRQVVTESTLLALLGGALGLVLSFLGTGALLSLVPEEVPRAAEIATDLDVLGFTLLVSLVTGVLFGLFPALQYSGEDLFSAVREGGGRFSTSRTRSRIRNWLIIGEVGVSLVLLVGAGLMVRTFLKLTEVDPGFDPHGVTAGKVFIPDSKYGEDAQVTGFYREVLERTRGLPGVESAGAILSLPINFGIRGSIAFNIEGRVAEPGQEPVCGYQLISTDYFRTMGIPLLRGRAFTEADNENAPLVAMINRALADEMWPGEDPLGRRVTWDDPEDEEVGWAEIVGITGNTLFESLDTEPRSEVYRPYSQAPMPFMSVVVRSGMEPEAVISSLRQVVSEVDPVQPVTEPMSMDRVLAVSLAQRRFNMQLLGIFALTALIMAAIGLYGVLSFAIAQRSNEIGIRMAIGADRGMVIGMVLREGFGLVLIGLGLGTAAALVLSGLVSSMVYGVSAADPLTFMLGAILLALVALAACFIPAWRAARTDPMVVLRIE